MMDDPSRLASAAGTEPQHLDNLCAQKRHAGGVGFSRDSNPREVGSQMCTDLGQDRVHAMHSLAWRREGQVDSGVGVEDGQLGGVECQLYQLTNGNLGLR